MRSIGAALGLASIGALALACSEQIVMTDAATDAALAIDATEDDPEPVFSAEELATLRALHYESAVPTDPSNRVHDVPAARALGQRLFFDTALSGPLLDFDNMGPGSTLGYIGEAGRVACASCHVPSARFVDARSPHGQVSLGAHWTKRRSPTLLEIARAPLLNWDGRRDSLWSQAIGVIESDVEFNSSRLYVARQIERLYREEYEAIFGAMPDLSDIPILAPHEAGCEVPANGVQLCHGRPGDADYDALPRERQDDITRIVVNVAKAIAAYVAQLRCGPSRFDAWLDGDATALSRAEQRGAALFAGRARCASCHNGPVLSDGQFHNVGLVPRVVSVAIIDQDDHGAIIGVAEALRDPLNTRGVFSDGDRQTLPDVVLPEMESAFRTPTLRCIDDQSSFMHTAQIQSLEAVISFFDQGGDEAGYEGVNELQPLGLSRRERADLVAFLRALGGPGPDRQLLNAPVD